MPSHRHRAETTLHTLAVWNLVLAMLWGLWTAFWIFIVVFGMMTKKDEQEIEDVMVGGAMLGFPGIVCCLIHLIAGFGLLKQRTWGYYFHVVGAIAAAFTCFGLVYTIYALSAISKADMKEDHYRDDYDDYEEPRRRRRNDDYREERRGRSRYEEDDEFDNRGRRHRREEENPDDY
jgi:hypothetical protein